MAEKVLKYSEVLAKVKKLPNNILLLGNGFSIAYNAQCFSFTCLKKDSPVSKFEDKNNA